MRRMSHIPGVFENDALSLEYKLANGDTSRHANITDFIGDAALERFLSTHVFHRQEQRVDVFLRQAGMAAYDVGD